MKNFFSKNWVREVLKAAFVIAFSLVLTSDELFEDKVQNLNSGYGKNQLIVLLLYFIDREIGRPIIFILLSFVALYYLYRAYKKYPN